MQDLMRALTWDIGSHRAPYLTSDAGSDMASDMDSDIGPEVPSDVGSHMASHMPSECTPSSHSPVGACPYIGAEVGTELISGPTHKKWSCALIC